MINFYLLLGLVLVAFSQGNTREFLSLKAVCYNNNRYMNANAFQSQPNQIALTQNSAAGNISSNGADCHDIRIDQTITSSGKPCNCPLVQKRVCVNDVPYANPCFAKCLLPNSGYSDYKNCPATMVNPIQQYTYPNKQCVECENLIYNPVCIGTSYFSNECFARCLAPNKTFNSCGNITQNAITNYGNCICFATVNPVCFNGLRYINLCVASCNRQTQTFYRC